MGLDRDDYEIMARHAGFIAVAAVVHANNWMNGLAFLGLMMIWELLSGLQEMMETT